MIVKPHVQQLKWHKPDQKHFKLWERLIGRQEFKVTSNTRVCSNHFVHGKPLGKHEHPELWLRGYEADKEISNYDVAGVIETWFDVDEQNDVFKTTRKGAIKRKPTHTPTTVTKCKRLKEQHDTEESETLSFNKIAFQNDHTYSQDEQSKICTTSSCCQSTICFKCKKEILQMSEENERLREENCQLRKSLHEAKEVIENNKMDKYSIDKIKDSDTLLKLHTGLDSYALFDWTFNHVKDKVGFIQYYKGPDHSHNVKRYQVNKGRKPGPERMLSPENELLITLMKLRLHLNSQFLGHLFGISQSLVTVILST